MMTFEKCAIIGYSLKPGELKPLVGSTIEYETEYVGKVKITIPAYSELVSGDFDRYIIAGICKNRTLEGKEPVLIDNDFIRNGYKRLGTPLSFEEKWYHLLKVLYSLGGKHNKEFDLNSSKHFPLAFCDPEEFTRLIDYLKEEGFITMKNSHIMGRGKEFQVYMGVKLTKAGKSEAIKALPKMPLFGLVSQEITTGDSEVDSKINHARELFFSEPSSLEKKRSACETLSFVLEPLREDLKNYFSQRDVSDFFQLVNKFDIRHNKETTKTLVHEEQLEWVFYSLLNSINTYTKLKRFGK